MVDKLTISDRKFTFGIDQSVSEDSITEGYAEDIVNAFVDGGRLRKRKGQEYRTCLPLNVIAADSDVGYISAIVSDGTDSGSIHNYLETAKDIELVGSMLFRNISNTYNEPMFGYAKYKLFSIDTGLDTVSISNDSDNQLVTGDRVVFTHDLSTIVPAVVIPKCTDIRLQNTSYWVRLYETTDLAPALASYTLHTSRLDSLSGANPVDLSSVDTTTMPGYIVQPRVLIKKTLRISAGAYEVGEQAGGTTFIKCSTPLASSLEETIPCVMSLYAVPAGAAYLEVEPEHIDGYLSPTGDRLVAGAEGVQYAENTLPNVTESYPNIRAYIAAETTIGPAIWDTGENPGRTSGYITCDNGAGHFLRINSFNFVSVGLAKLSCTATNLQVFGGVLADIITPGEDQVTLANMHRELLNGTFGISAISQIDANTIELTIEIVELVDTRYDQASDLFGQCHILTDKINVSDNTLVVGDLLNHYCMKDETTGELLFDATVVSSAADKIVVGPIRDVVTLCMSRTYNNEEIPTDFIPGTRTTTTVPVRGIYAYGEGTFTNADIDTTNFYINVTLSSDGFSVYDMVELVPDGASFSPLFPLQLHKRYYIIDFYESDPSKLVLGLSPYDETGLVFSASAQDPYADLSLQSFTVRNIGCDMVAGDAVVVDNSPYTHRVVSAEPHATVAGVTNVTFPYAIEFTDSELNTQALTIARRMELLTSPVDDFLTTGTTAPINVVDNTVASRSSVSAGCMYGTNYIDAVRKYDGQNSYVAGLPPFQPTGSCIIDTSASTKISYPFEPVACVATKDSSTITMSVAGDISKAKQFVVGDLVTVTGTNVTTKQFFTITNISFSSDDTTKATITLNGTVLGSGALAATYIVKVVTYKYYYRYIATDAQNNQTASAVSDLSGTEVRLTEAAAVGLGLSNLPSYDKYNYNRIDLEIFRNKADSLTTFYRLDTIPLSFDVGENTIYYVDSKSDMELSELDSISSTLLGNEVGVAWSQPPRAKCVTAVDNMLVLGNLKLSPELNLSFIDSSIALDSYDGLEFCLAKKSPGSVSTASVEFTDQASYVHKFRFEKDITKVYTDVSITVSSGIVTVNTTSAIPNLAVGDWVYLMALDGAKTTEYKHAGYHQVSAVDSVNHTFSFKSKQTETSSNKYNVVAATDGVVPVIYRQTLDTNLDNVVPSATNTLDQLADSLSKAINAVMASVDTSIDFGTSEYDQYNWAPWLLARSGGSFGTGQVVITSPSNIPFLGWFVPKALTGQSRPLVKVNGVRRKVGEVFGSETPLFPGRLAVSYPNFPEIFDNLSAVDVQYSDSLIDVDSSNGEEITAIVPFFGEAAFDQSKQAAHVVVFKEKSIYIVDLRQKDLYRRSGGQIGLANPVQKLETNGLGCNIPYSVSVSKNAIFFANSTGIWALRRDLSLQFIGEKLGKMWDRVSLFSSCHAHHDPKQTSYMLSIALDDDSYNRDVFVYNYREEEKGQMGSWTRYNNYPAAGWANLGYEGFYQSVYGEIYGTRDRGLTGDYSDDGTAIESSVLLRAMDFGDSGTGKHVKYAIMHYRPYTQVSSIRLYSSMDFATTLTQASSFRVNVDTTTDNLSDIGTYKLIQLRHSFEDARGVYFQLKLVWDGVDEPMDFCGVSYRVSPLDDKYILEASKTLD